VRQEDSAASSRRSNASHGKRQQRVHTDVESNLHHVAELHIGDEDAEHEDLDHRPGAQFFDKREDATQVTGRMPLAQPDQHIEGADQLAERREHRDEHDNGGELRHVPSDQLLGS